MTAFDDDPEYEAQLKDALGEQISEWQTPQGQTEEEFGDFAREGDNQSEDGVLEDVPTFRMKLRPETPPAELRIARDDDEASLEDLGEDKALSEDARSVSTGDDSPSAQVRSRKATFDSRDLKSRYLRR
jgi:hypothetical protein